MERAGALNLFINHPSLIGFESPSRMLVTAVKEIFEVCMISVKRLFLSIC